MSGSFFVIPISASEVVATVRGAASQSANLQEWQSSASTILSRISSSGQFVSDQQTYIGSGATSISNARFNVATGSASVIGQVIRGASGQTADLLAIQNDSGTSLLSINSGGNLFATNGVRTSNIANLATSANSRISMGASTTLIDTSVATNIPLQVQNINASPTGDLTRWLDTSSTVLASVSSIGTITTSGNINTTGQARVGTATSLGQLSVVTATSGVIGAVIRGAASQSVNLTEWQDSAGGVLAFIRNGGNLGIGSLLTGTLVGFNNSVGAGTVLQLRGSSNQSGDQVQYQASAGTVLGGRNGVGQIFTGSTTPILTAAGGTIQSIATGANPLVTMATGPTLTTGDLVTLAGTTGGTYNGTFVVASTPSVGTFTITTALTVGQASPGGTVSKPAQASITSRSSGTTGLIVKGASFQSSNLQEWQDSSGTIVSRIESTGNLVVPGTSGAISSGTFIVGSRNSGAEITMVRQTAATSNPGSNLARIYFRDGTVPGTLKLVVRAGAAGAETTILDNIPQ
jgi:hypothetical protein